MSRAAKFVLSRDAIRRLDEATTAAGVAAIDLMERAGRCVARTLEQGRFRAMLTAVAQAPSPPRSLLVLAGPGNNGGDGLVVARLMAEKGWTVTVALCGRPPRPGSPAAVNLERWQRIGGSTIPVDACLALLAAGGQQRFDVLVDALLGTGLERPIAAPFGELIAVMNSSSVPVLAIDIPSGLCADSGQPLGAAVVADRTITLGAAKPGLFLGRGPDYGGRIEVADIGLLDPSSNGIDAVGEVIDSQCCKAWLPIRARMTHKGQLGHVLLLGGAAGRTGAIVLAARAALRAGAGLVTMGVPAPFLASVDAALPEAMTLPLADNGSGEPAESAWSQLRGELERFDTIVIGPGLGQGAGARILLHSLIEEFAGPLVVDADGITLAAAETQPALGALLAAREAAGRGPLLLTPHPGEMARLSKSSSAAVQADRLAVAKHFAASHAATLVLKGAATLVARKERVGFNSSGNPGMAGPGMGDVLAGALGALLAGSGLDPFEAAALAVYAHGLAGDILESRLQGPGFLAAELADTLPAAFSMLRSGPPA